MIEYMQLRRNEYESSTQLIKLSGTFEKINLCLQNGFFEKCKQYKSEGVDLENYSELLYYNKWYNLD